MSFVSERLLPCSIGDDMITKFLLSLIFGLVKFLLSILPTFPTIDVKVDFTLLMQAIRFLNQFIDLRVVGYLMGAYLTVLLIMFIWSLVNWILHKIPGVS